MKTGGKKIIKVKENYWRVPSESGGGYYDVVLNVRLRKFTCNCPAFLFRNKELKPCKHIIRLASEIKSSKLSIKR